MNRGIPYGSEPRNQLDHYVLHTGDAEDKVKRPLVLLFTVVIGKAAIEVTIVSWQIPYVRLDTTWWCQITGFTQMSDSRVF